MASVARDERLEAILAHIVPEQREEIERARQRRFETGEQFTLDDSTLHQLAELFHGIYFQALKIPPTIFQHFTDAEQHAALAVFFSTGDERAAARSRLSEIVETIVRDRMTARQRKQAHAWWSRRGIEGER